MKIISRKEWGARHAAAYQNRDAPLPAKRVWLHHSATIAPDLRPPFDDDAAAVRTLERIGQERFGWGISYSFAVTPTGRVYQGHRIDGLGAHTGGQNSTSRAICLVGNYQTAAPTWAQLTAVAELLTHGHQAGWWTEPRLAGGHRDAPGAATTCPGRHGHAAVARINALAGQPDQEDEMALSDADIEKIAKRTAELVWQRATRNAFGHTVAAEQILVGAEHRIAQVQAVTGGTVGQPGVSR